MRKLISLILCLCLVAALPIAVQAEENVLRINSLEDFLQFAENCRLDAYSQGLTVKLYRDLDLTGADFAGIPSFSGTFEGNGYHIKGLELTHAGSYVGLFRYLTQDAVVRDLHVEGYVAPTGKREFVGGIAGQNSGILENCTFTGSVAGSQYVGGLVGKQTLTGIVVGCSVAGSVQGSHFVGGLVGTNSGVIRNCENTAAVNTLLEQNSISLEDITLETLTGAESATTVTDIGGIAGTGTGVIRNCVNRGDVGYPQIGYNIGGIIGSTSGYLLECINNGTIQGRKEVGGIAGQLEPAVSILFSQDALQTLQGQMSGLGGAASAMGSHAQSGASALRQQADKLDKEVANAKEAVGMLAPTKEFPHLPDLDTIQASKNALADSFTGMNESVTSMASITKSTLSTLSSDMQNLAGQLSAIGGTISTASDNLGATLADVSDADTPDDLTSKLQGCRNAGPVSGDWNVGGIAGAIAIENDLDPDSDLDLFGEYSLNFAMELRSVIIDCENAAAVSGNKQNTGGILGWMSMGLVKSCVSTASVKGAEYTGGIVGNSEAAIRDCVYRGAIQGNSYTGGIAGTAQTITDCAAITELTTQSQFQGAILGYSKDAYLSGNYYLPVERDPGAVDGISYAEKAQPLDREAFFALPHLPQALHMVTVTFQMADGTQAVRVLPYGTRFNDTFFPALPQQEGAEGYWDSPVSTGDPLCFDILIQAVYEVHSYTLSSQNADRHGLPLVLLQGDFLPGSALSMESRDTTGIEAWNLSLPDSAVTRKLRYLLPRERAEGEVAVMGLVGEKWQALEYTRSGSYLVMEIPQGLTAIEIFEVPEDNSWQLYAAIGGVAALAIVLTTLFLVRRKKKKAVQQPATTEA